MLEFYRHFSFLVNQVSLSYESVGTAIRSFFGCFLSVSFHFIFNVPFTVALVSLIDIQGVSRLVDITAGGDFLGLCDQKS
jgi:hypothetical protein